MKNNSIYLVSIFILISCEIIAFRITKAQYGANITFVFRELVTIILAIWYYRELDQKLNKTQKKFLIIILVPLLLGLSSYIIPSEYAIKINTFFYFVIYVLWMNIIYSLGASFNKKRFPRTYYLLVPIIFSIPIVYYFMVLFPMLDSKSKVLSFLFALFAGSKYVYILFLPITKYFSGRYLIILGVWLEGITNMMQSYFYFESESLFIYPFARLLQTTSTVILIVGMIYYFKRTSKIIIE
ncbi:MAG: hypothetical protein KA313_11735 [Pseudarcicella sp.]|nr:hypothetical protein [Pseudarcicella sp.]